MNNILGKPLLALTLALTLAGCGTTPASTYYLLSAEATELPSGATPSLGIGPVEIPEYLNRNAFIYNRDGNKLHIASFERWAEPMDSGVSRVVSLNLASLLKTQNVQAYPWPNSERPEYAVAITLLSLDANDNHASLVAEWRLHRPQSGETIMRRISKIDYDMPAGPVTAAEVAPAYSELLHQLSEIIAAEISADYLAGQPVD